MFSIRFQAPVVFSTHAKMRMLERGISGEQLLKVIDEGETRFKDASHLWTFIALPGRQDNLLCAVLVLEKCVVVKTVMHHFTVL